jgi:hypothetical protein
MEQASDDWKHYTDRTAQLVQNNEDRVAGTGRAGKDSLDRMAWKEHPGKDGQDRTARKDSLDRIPGQYSQAKTAKTGNPGQDINL